MSRVRRGAIAFGFALLLPAVGFGPCSDEKEVHEAEARRAALLADTRPKSEFWAQVERKGAAAKSEKATTLEIAKAKAQRDALTAEIAASGARLNDAKAQRAAAEAALADGTQKLEKARGERAQREEILSRFTARQRARDAS
jgi:hypothetical protein